MAETGAVEEQGQEQADDKAPGQKKGQDELDKDAFKQRVKDNTARAIRHAGRWIGEAREDFRFAAGDQWTPEEIELLNTEKRPALTINKISVQLEVITGHQRQNAERIRVSPEGGEDQVFSETFDKAMAYVDKVGSLEFKLGQAFDCGFTCGKSVMEVGISYEKDPLHGDLFFRSHGPFTVFKDPDSKEYDLSDASFCVKVDRFTKDQLKAMYPKKKKEIDELGESGSADEFSNLDTVVKVEGDKDNYANRKRTSAAYAQGQTELEESRANKHTLVEYWYKKYVDQWFIYDLSTTRLAKFDSAEKAKARIAELKGIYSTPDPQTQLPADPATVAVLDKMDPIQRSMPEIWVYAMASGLELADGESPLEPRLNKFPFFFYLSYWMPYAELAVHQVQGLVRRLKDPQREVNKARSQYLHMINTSANSGWIGDSDALTKTQWKQLEQFGSKAGVIIQKKPGSDLHRIEPVPPSIAEQVREKAGTENMKEVSGVNPDLLSVEDKTTSGRAIAMRVKQALTIVAGPFENWQMTKRLIGEAIFQLMPDVMDKDKLARIVGDSFMNSAQLNVGMLGAYLAQVEDGRYNVSISEGAESPTTRMETFEQLLDISTKSGMPFPPEVLLKFSNVPNATEVAKQIEAYQAKAAQAAAAQKAGGGLPAGPTA